MSDSKWIPVGERLPERAGEYLIATNDPTTGVIIACWNGRWFVSESDGLYLTGGEYVTTPTGAAAMSNQPTAVEVLAAAMRMGKIESEIELTKGLATIYFMSGTAGLRELGIEIDGGQADFDGLDLDQTAEAQRRILRWLEESDDGNKESNQ